MYAPVGEIDKVNAFGQVVERDFIAGAPVAAPVYGGMAEIDKVNAFGQVVERDFVGGVPQVFAQTLPTQVAATTVLGTSYPPTTYPTALRSLPATTVSQVPATTVVGGFGEIDKVNAFGQVVERDFVGGVPQVIGGFPSYAPAYASPATTAVVGGIGEIDKVNAFGQVVERDFVGGVPQVIGGFPSYAPAYASPATTATYAAPTYAAPVLSGSYVGGIGEIDKVNAFGQVVERDFVGGVPRVLGGATYAAPATLAAPATTVYGGPSYAAPMYGGIGEIDKVNAFGQVVERDFIGGVPRVVAPTVVSGSYAPPVTEIDKVNAFGQVVERDFAYPGLGPRVATTPAYAPTTVLPSYAPTTFAAPTTVYGSAPRTMYGGGVAEIDKVNAFGQVVERDFLGAPPVSTVL